jgi:hypothetical protein
MSNASPQFALDRSMRTQDPFGRLKVEWTNISKANVCPYLGKEIPGYQALGLDAAKVYMLWRHPDELAKAAHTFDMVPLMDEHIVTDADNPELHAVAGTIGSGVRFKYPYLQAPMAIWVGDSVDDVKTRKKRQLSCGYGYEPDMTPGHTPEGVAYDGVMRHIIGNHVTIVKAGRAGPDVLVADEDPFIGDEPVMFKRKSVVEAVVAALAGVTVSPEQQTALDAALDAVIIPLEALATDKANTAAKDALKKMVHGESCDCGAAGCGSKAPAKDDTGKVGNINPATGRAPEGGAPNPAAAKDEKVDTVTKDEATKLVNDAAAAAVKDALDKERALVAARQDVADVVGNVALDSAEAVYRHALTKEKVTGADTIHASALPTVWGIHKARKTASASQALDAQIAPSADAKAALASIGL